MTITHQFIEPSPALRVVDGMPIGPCEIIVQAGDESDNAFLSSLLADIRERCKAHVAAKKAVPA